MVRSKFTEHPADECSLCGVELQPHEKETCKMCNPHVPPVPPPRPRYCEDWLAEVSTSPSDEFGSFTMRTQCSYRLNPDGTCTNPAPHQKKE